MIYRVVDPSCPSSERDYLRNIIMQEHDIIYWREKNLTKNIVYDEQGDFVPSDKLLHVYNYLDVHSIDITDGIMSNTSCATCIVAWNGDYVGLIYMWVNGNRASVMGLRKNIYTEIKGVGRFLLDSCIEVAKKMGCRDISIICPLDTVMGIASKMGFKECVLSGDQLLHTPLGPHDVSGYTLEFD